VRHLRRRSLRALQRRSGATRRQPADVRVMQERGIDITSQRSKGLAEYLGSSTSAFSSRSATAPSRSAPSFPAWPRVCTGPSRTRPPRLEMKSSGSPRFRRGPRPDRRPRTGVAQEAPQTRAQPARAHEPSLPQLGWPPVSQPRMIAWAQPTPGSTPIAPGTQLRAQAPHSMQAPRSASAARPSAMAKTARGPDGHTQSAAGAALGVEPQGDGLVDIAQSRHRPHLPRPAGRPGVDPQAPTARVAAAACSGSARRISSSTPEGEVIGEEPVKFMAAYDDTAGTPARRAIVAAGERRRRNAPRRPPPPRHPPRAPFQREGAAGQPRQRERCGAAAASRASQAAP